MNVSESDRLVTLHSLGILDTPGNPEIDHLLTHLVSLLDVPMGLLTLVDEQRQWFKSNHGLPGTTQTEREIAFCDHTIRSDNLLVVEDSHLDQRFAENPLVTGDLGLRFYAGAPLLTTEGARLGALCVLDKQPRALNESQREILTLYSAIAVDLLVAESTRRTPQISLYVDKRNMRVVYGNTLAITMLAPSAGPLYGQSVDKILPQSLQQLPASLTISRSWNLPEKNALTHGDLLRIDISPKSAASASGEPSRSTKSRILNAAKICLVEEGNGAFSMRKVAAAANLALGNVQYYFPTRTLLINSILDSVAESFWHHYAEDLANIPNPTDRLLACANFILYSGPDHQMIPMLREFWSMAPREQAIADKLHEFYSACQRLAFSLIQEANPGLSTEHARLLATELVALLSGAFLFTESMGSHAPTTGFHLHLLRRIVAMPWIAQNSLHPNEYSDDHHRRQTRIQMVLQ